MLDALLLAKTPALLKSVYPDCLWKKETKEKVLYLTFDDGPQAEITPFVLNELKRWNAKATFFCIGKNIEQESLLFKRILEEGHAVGNHTQNHLNGWKNASLSYFENIATCDEVLRKHKFEVRADGLPMFRPPYGKLKPMQYRKLKKKYTLVMWDVLAFDFDLSISENDVLKNVLNNAEAGSIIVMHDSLKAKPKVEFALPEILRHFSEKGFRFEAL